MKRVSSKSVSMLGYDPDTKIMRAQFYSETQYDYYNISQAEYDSIVNDHSIGSKLRRVVSGKEYKKL